jgi:hypothetical protein
MGKPKRLAEPIVVVQRVVRNLEEYSSWKRKVRHGEIDLSNYEPSAVRARTILGMVFEALAAESDDRIAGLLDNVENIVASK